MITANLDSISKAFYNILILFASKGFVLFRDYPIGHYIGKIELICNPRKGDQFKM